MVKMNAVPPKYISLYHSGELKRRVDRLNKRLAACDICPRECGVNRLEGETKFCHSGRRPIVASVCDHHGEEPVLSGRRGSGTIFLGNCNLRCLYCQNYLISQDWEQQRHNETSCQRLAEQMLSLQELGCHNINLVSPSHFVPQLVEGLVYAVPLGLKIPLVYNSNSYDSMKTLVELDGIIDIYLPDLKYADDKWAGKLSQAKGYVAIARSAIREMWRQVGRLELDEEGVARKGVIVRHLILPNGLAGSEQSLKWLAEEVSADVALSLMSQYYPRHRAPRVPLLSRTISKEEYAAAFKVMAEMGLKSGWVQGMGSPRHYLPDFDGEGHPFAMNAEG